MRNLTIGLMLLGVSSASFAYDDTMQCFGAEVFVGDTETTLIQACGNPSAIAYLEGKTILSYKRNGSISTVTIEDAIIKDIRN